MELFLLGLLVVGVATGLILSDMERKRRAVAQIVERLEPLVPRNRRLALHNLRRLSQSVFYAQNLIAQIEREIALLEKECRIEAPDDDESRFSMRVSRQLASMADRISAIEAIRNPPVAAEPATSEPGHNPNGQTPPALEEPGLSATA